jgi:type I restriction enzyme S subunit
VFAIKRGKIKDYRNDVGYWHPKYEIILNKIKSKYLITPFSEYIESLSGGATPLRSDETQYTEEGVKFLRIQNVTPFGIDLSDTKHITDDIHNGLLFRSQLAENDVLMTITGRIGTCAVVKEKELPANINQHIVRIRLKDGILPDFVSAFLNSDLGIFLSNRGVTGTTRIALDYESIRNIPIPELDVNTQKYMLNLWNTALTIRSAKLQEADKLLAGMDAFVLKRLEINLPFFNATLAFGVKRKDILNSEIYCRPTYPAYMRLITALKTSSHYQGTLENYISVNPQTDVSLLNDEDSVSFVPMAMVGNKDNTVVYEKQLYKDVKTGYTVFKRDDLLWAKITPCMQNGKSCLVSNLPTEIGFGSTEFHVLRNKSDKVYMPYIWAVLSNGIVLQTAQTVFGGSAGHQRVSDSFLKNFPLPLPDMVVQQEIADNVFENLGKIYALKREAEAEWAAAKAQFERELIGL